MLHVALPLAVTADDVGVTGAVAGDRSGIGGRGRVVVPWGRIVIAERFLLSMNGSNLVDLFIGELVPEDGVGLSWLAALLI